MESDTTRSKRGPTSGGSGRNAREVANERLRVGFLAQVGPQLLELRELLGADAGPEARESVAHDLVRTAETAASLGLEQLATVADIAADQVRGGGDPGVLRSVAAALRRARGRELLGDVVVVTDAPHAARLRAAAHAVAEPVRVLDRADALFADLLVTRPAVLAVPAVALDDVRRLAGEGFPIVVHGDPADWAQRVAAAEAGARGWLPAGYPLDALLDLARAAAAAEDEAEHPTVFLLAPDDPARRSLVDAFELAGVAVVPSAAPSDLGLALEHVGPDALVFAAVGDADARSLIRAARAHPAGHVPLVVVGDPPEPEALLAAGADDVLRSDATPGEVVARVEARARRLAALAGERCAVTSLPGRAAVLRLLDRHASHAAARGQALTVALVQLEGLAGVRDRYGKAAVLAAQRILGGLLERGVRRADVVGRLAPDVFVVGLPSCRAAEAHRRLEALVAPFARRCRGDRRLESLGVSIGLADTETRPDGLLRRAEADLLRARTC